LFSEPLIHFLAACINIVGIPVASLMYALGQPDEKI